MNVEGEPAMPRSTGWVLLVVLMSVPTVRAADDGFVSLLEGDDPKQLTLVAIGPEAIRIQGGEIRLTGKPDGYFATRRSYRNYTLRFEWMYERPEKLESEARFRGNSGLLLHITGPDKVWPKCIEVQLANDNAGDIFAIFGARFQGKKDGQAQKRAVKPVGEWNRMEVTCREGAITCLMNGIEVARGAGAEPDGGRIGWQSEGTPIRFRRLEIRPLD